MFIILVLKFLYIQSISTIFGL